MSSMFRDAPSTAQSVPIFRIGSKKYGNFHALILDERPIFVTTHYVRGLRTQPCLESQCKWCQTKDDNGEDVTPQPKRERAYIGIVHVERKLRGVLELTATAGSELLDQAKANAILGQIIKCDRETANANSAIKLEPTPQHVELEKLDRWRADWSTVAALCATWGIDDPRVPKLHAPQLEERGHDEEDVWINRRNGQGVAS